MTENNDRQFPVLFQCHSLQQERKLRAAMPPSVPWALVAEHEAQCQRNHQQSVQRLAKRGGLSPAELLCVLRDEQFDYTMTDLQAVPQVLQRVRDWLAETGGHSDTDDE